MVEEWVRSNEEASMKKALIASTIVVTGLFGLGLAAWALQQGPMESPMRGFEPGESSARLLRLLESDRVKSELGLSDDQVQRLHQVIVEAEKSSLKTRADLAIRGIELRELLRSNNPDRNVVMSKVQEISNLRGEMMKQLVGALIAAKAVLTPEQQKKIRAFIESRRPAAPGQMRMGPPGGMGPQMRMGPPGSPAPGAPPACGCMANPSAACGCMASPAPGATPEPGSMPMPPAQ